MKKNKEADKIDVPPYPEITQLVGWKTNLTSSCHCLRESRVPKNLAMGCGILGTWKNL